MTNKEILEAIKAGKKLDEEVLNYLVNSSYVVKEIVFIQGDEYTDIRTVVKLDSQHIVIDWTKDNNGEENEFLYQPYLIKLADKN